MQVQQGSVNNHQYKSVLNCYYKILTYHGIKGLFRGSIATLWRETLPGGVYLTLYDYLCKKMEAKKQDKIIKDIIYMISGSITGVTFWFISYPFDTIKSKMQADDLKNPKYKSFQHCI